MITAVVASGQNIKICDTLRLMGMCTAPEFCKQCAAIDVKFTNLLIDEFRCDRIYQLDSIDGSTIRLYIEPRNNSDELFVSAHGERLHINVSPSNIKAGHLYGINLCGTDNISGIQQHIDYSKNTSTKSTVHAPTRAQELAKLTPTVEITKLQNNDIQQKITQNVAKFMAEINYAFTKNIEPEFPEKIGTDALVSVNYLWAACKFKFPNRNVMCEACNLGDGHGYSIREVNITTATDERKLISIVTDNTGIISNVSLSLPHNVYNKLLVTCDKKDASKYNYMISFLEDFLTLIQTAGTYDLPDNCKYKVRNDSFNREIPKTDFAKYLIGMSKGLAGNYNILCIDEETSLYFVSFSITANSIKKYIGMEWNFSAPDNPVLQYMLLSEKNFTFSY